MKRTLVSLAKRTLVSLAICAFVLSCCGCQQPTKKGKSKKGSRHYRNIVKVENVHKKR